MTRSDIETTVHQRVRSGLLGAFSVRACQMVAVRSTRDLFQAVFVACEENRRIAVLREMEGPEPAREFKHSVSESVFDLLERCWYAMLARARPGNDLDVLGYLYGDAHCYHFAHGPLSGAMLPPGEEAPLCQHFLDVALRLKDLAVFGGSRHENEVAIAARKLLSKTPPAPPLTRQDWLTCR